MPIEDDDESILDVRLAMWELLENPTARKVIHEFFEDAKEIHQNETSAYMMVGVSQQVKDTLKDQDGGALSVKYIVDAIIDWSIEPTFTETIEALYRATHKTIVDPNTPKWLNKIFDFLEACAKTYRGPEVVRAFADGLCKIMEKPNVKKQILKAFENGKELISTSIREKIKHFFSRKKPTKSDSEKNSVVIKID